MGVNDAGKSKHWSLEHDVTYLVFIDAKTGLCLC